MVDEIHNNKQDRLDDEWASPKLVSPDSGTVPAQRGETKPICKGCGTHSSWFWYRYSFGCDSEGNYGKVFHVCDVCQVKLADLLGGSL